MEPEKVQETIRPYVTEQLLHLARKGLKSIGDDLVLYLDTEDCNDIMIYDRKTFLSRVQPYAHLRRKLNEPARVKAARTQTLYPQAVVVWFLVVLPDGSVRAQVLTLDNHYRYTTYFVGLA